MIASLLLLAGAIAGPAEDGDNAQLRLQVLRLVRQLDNDTLAERQAAEQALIELGPPALDVLPPSNRAMSAEVTVRLERVRQAWEKAVAQAAAEPSRVTLQGAMKLSAAFEAIQQQTGNKIVDFRERFGQAQADPVVETGFQDVTFWEALDRLLDQAGMTVYNFVGEKGAIAVIAAEDSDRDRADRASYAGLFRFEGVRVQATRDLRNAEDGQLRVMLDVTWEPRLAPIVLRIPVATVVAVSGSGDPIPVDGTQGVLEVPVEDTIANAELVVPLVAPDRSVARIASLRGELGALVTGRVESFEFDKLMEARDVQQSVAGVRVTLDQVRKNLELYEVRMRVKFERAGIALESHRNWVYDNEAYMLDPEGERIENAGSQATRQGSDEVGVAYLFDREAGLEGCKFIYKTPSLLINVPVQYELKDIPLP